jgi:hypothetical protein
MELYEVLLRYMGAAKQRKLLHQGSQIIHLHARTFGFGGQWDWLDVSLQCGFAQIMLTSHPTRMSTKRRKRYTRLWFRPPPAPPRECRSAAPATQTEPGSYADSCVFGFRRLPSVARDLAAIRTVRFQTPRGTPRECRSATPARQNEPGIFSDGFGFGFGCRRRLPESAQGPRLPRRMGLAATRTVAVSDSAGASHRVPKSRACHAEWTQQLCGQLRFRPPSAATPARQNEPSSLQFRSGSVGAP